MTPDQPITFAITAIGCVLSFVLPKRWALLPLAASICWHPSVLLVPPPQLSMTAQRIIALALIGRCVLSADLRSTFKWRLIDTAVMFYFACVTGTLMLNAELGSAINNRAGFFLSAILPYFCARFLLIDRDAFFTFMKGFLWTAVPLAIMGQVEMHTAFSPWDRIRDFGILGPLPRKTDGWRIFMGEMKARARGPFVQYIMFGWFFAILMALSTSLYFQKKKLLPWIVAWGIMPLGIISSIASGPMMLAGSALGLTMLFPLRSLWKVGVGVAAVGFIAAIGYSNRSPMQMIASFGFDPNSSWYRYKLVNFVLDQGGMKGHWFAGYGEIPGFYGSLHDLCIHWVWLLVLHGIIGLVGFYGMITALGWELWKARKKAQSLADEYLLWTFMATLVGSLLAMLVVALFSEMYYIYHLMIGVMANAPLYMGAGGASGARHVGVLAHVNGKPVLLRYTLKPGQRLALVRQGGEAEPLREERGSVKVPGE